MTAVTSGEKGQKDAFRGQADYSGSVKSSRQILNLSDELNEFSFNRLGIIFSLTNKNIHIFFLLRKWNKELFKSGKKHFGECLRY